MLAHKARAETCKKQIKWYVIMRKLLRTFFVFAVFALIVACMGKPGERTRLVEETYPIEKICTEFLEKHKDFNTNDIT